jgi:hypothetical protein
MYAAPSEANETVTSSAQSRGAHTAKKSAKQQAQIRAELLSFILVLWI